MVKVMMKNGGVVTFVKGTHYGIGEKDGVLYVYEGVNSPPTAAVASFMDWSGVWNTDAAALSFA